LQQYGLDVVASATFKLVIVIVIFASQLKVFRSLNLCYLLGLTVLKVEQLIELSKIPTIGDELPFATKFKLVMLTFNPFNL